MSFLPPVPLLFDDVLLLEVVVGVGRGHGRRLPPGLVSLRQEGGLAQRQGGPAGGPQHQAIRHQAQRKQVQGLRQERAQELQVGLL